MCSLELVSLTKSSLRRGSGVAKNLAELVLTGWFSNITYKYNFHSMFSALSLSRCYLQAMGCGVDRLHHVGRNRKEAIWFDLKEICPQNNNLQEHFFVLLFVLLTLL